MLIRLFRLGHTVSNNLMIHISHGIGEQLIGHLADVYESELEVFAVVPSPERLVVVGEIVCPNRAGMFGGFLHIAAVCVRSVYLCGQRDDTGGRQSRIVSAKMEFQWIPDGFPPDAYCR